MPPAGPPIIGPNAPASAGHGTHVARSVESAPAKMGDGAHADMSTGSKGPRPGLISERK